MSKLMQFAHKLQTFHELVKKNEVTKNEICS